MIKYLDLDMDQVLVDFVGGACKAHGVNREVMESYRILGVWPINDPLGLASIGRSLTMEEFWKPINDAGEDFWYDLKAHHWFLDIVHLAEESELEWHIVSAPSNSVSSYTGKVRWLKRALGSDFNSFILTPHKHRFAQDSILIDDREENCVKYNKVGSPAIIFPSEGNSLYSQASNPIPYVRQELEKILCI